MEDRLKTIIEQAKDNGTHEQLMAAVREYEKTHVSGIPPIHAFLVKIRKEY